MQSFGVVSTFAGRKADPIHWLGRVSIVPAGAAESREPISQLCRIARCLVIPGLSLCG